LLIHLSITKRPSIGVVAEEFSVVVDFCQWFARILLASDYTLTWEEADDGSCVILRRRCVGRASVTAAEICHGTILKS
jgi:hypothetical protein